MMPSLILPGTLAWDMALQEIPPPPGWRDLADKTNGQMALIARAGSFGLLEAVKVSELEEYCYDGELEAREEELEAEDKIIYIP